MQESVLERMGLTHNESLIYLNLLREGNLLVGRISRNTGIHRRTVYDALERLIQKGLVVYIKENNRKYFSPANPARLLELLEERQSAVAEILPELQVQFSSAKQRRETLFFRGKRALHTLFDDQLVVGEPVLILGSSHFVHQILPFYFGHFDAARAKKKIPVRLLLPAQLRTDPALRRIPLAEVRFLPQEFTSDVSTNIYGGCVSVVLWSGEHSGLLIRLPELAHAYRMYFDLLWRLAQKRR